MANTETKVDLVINRMSQSKYEQLKSAGQLDPNQIYMTTDGTDPVPETRKVNGQTLEADVTLTGADIAVSTSDSTKINTALAGKAATNHTHSNYVPTSRTVNNKALSGNVTLTGADIAVSTSDSTKIDAALAGKMSATATGSAININNDPLAPSIDTAFQLLNQNKQDALTSQQLANIAAVPNKLDKSGGTMTGTLQVGDNAAENIILNPSDATITTEFIKNNYSNDRCFVPNGPGTLALAAATGHAGEIATLDANGNPVASGYDTSDFLTSVPTSYKTYVDTLTQLGTDGFKTYSATKTQLVTDGFKTYADTKTALDSIYKPLQTAKTSPTASGNTTSFIDTITQDANGVITATKKTIPSASTSAAGIVQLNNTLTSTSTTQAATANAVKTAYDECLKKDVNGQTMNGVKSLNFKSNLAFPDDSYTTDTLINALYFYDSTGYNLANLNTRQTKAGGAMLSLSMAAPFGDNEANITSYLRLYINKAGKYAYATVPTPPSNSNADVVATTEWVNDKLSGYKPTQTAKSSPTASGSTTSFIDTITQDANGVITATKKNVSFSGYKTTQTAVSDPTASGTATSFIDTISQNANGVITATKKSLPTASTSTAGIVQLNNGRTSTSTTVAPTANALKSAYDNCIHTSGTNQVINDCTTFRFDGTADWTVGDSAAHTINNIELRDVNDYLAGYLQTQRTASNNYVTNLVCRAPTGTSGAASSAAITIYITTSNGKYVGFPTPAATSNGAIGATTEWVNSRIDESWKRVTVGSSGVLENHAINVLTLTGTHKLYPPASLANSGNRHFYLLAINTSNQARSLKFFRYASGGAANTITYYMDDGYTPVTNIPKTSYFFYEFYETSTNMFYVKQTQIEDQSSVIGTNS